MYRVMTIGNFEDINEEKLREVSKLGSELVVGVMSDSCKLKLKMPTLKSDGKRAYDLNKLDFVDEVIYVSSDDLLEEDGIKKLLIRNDIDMLAYTDEMPMYFESEVDLVDSLEDAAVFVNVETTEFITVDSIKQRLFEIKEDILVLKSLFVMSEKDAEHLNNEIGNKKRK